MEPKYVELMRLFVKEIADGIYPIGSILPGEIELSEKHNVSRSTLRKTLERLQELGLISRTKKLGTRVERLNPQDLKYSPHMSTLDELFEFHLHTIRSISNLKEIIIDIELSQTLHCKAGEKWLQCLVTRTLNDEANTPLSYSDVYIDFNLIKGHQKQLLKTTVLINDFIAQVSGVTAKEIRQTISAINIEKKHAQLLGAEVGSPALKIKRQHLDERGKIYHVGISIIPADRFSYETQLIRDSNP